MRERGHELDGGTGAGGSALQLAAPGAGRLVDLLAAHLPLLVTVARAELRVRFPPGAWWIAAALPLGGNVLS